MVLLASFIGGIRWTLTQVLMQKAELGESLASREDPFNSRGSLYASTSQSHNYVYY